MHEVVKRLKTIISQSNVTIYQQQNDNLPNQIDEKPALDSVENSSHGELSQMIKKFHNMNTSEIESTSTTNEQIINENISSEKNLSILIKEIVALIFKIVNEGKGS